MKKLTIIIVVVLGLMHTVMDVSIHYYDFTAQQNTHIESYTDEEVFITLDEELFDDSNEKIFKHAPTKLSAIKVSQIWKPPVNS